MMPLSFGKNGEKYVIKKVNGKDDQRRHLANLGFVEGEEIEVAQRLGTNFIIAVKDSRIALSREMVSRIVVDNL